MTGNLWWLIANRSRGVLPVYSTESTYLSNSSSCYVAKTTTATAYAVRIHHGTMKRCVLYFDPGLIPKQPRPAAAAACGCVFWAG